MGKQKTNAYSVFVKDIFNRRKSQGDNVVFSSLFSELGSEWKNMSDGAKEHYKERAKSINDGTGGHYPSFKSSQSSYERSYTASTSSKSEYPTANPKMHNPLRPHHDKEEMKPDIDIKPNIRTQSNEQPRIKREHAEVEDDGVSDVNEARRIIEEDMGIHDQAVKKIRLGCGIPNWKNIKDTNQPEIRRYSDYYLYEMRNTCENLIKTRMLSNRLMTMPLYSFSCNVLCKYKKASGTSGFIPLEIGICAWSIKEGKFKSPYHVLIDPGETPMGYNNVSKDHALATHKITVGQGNYPEGSRNDYATIYKEMLNYVKPGERTILVSDPRDLEQVKSTIEWLFEKALQPGNAKPSTWTILTVVEYIGTMANYLYQNVLGHKSPILAIHYYIRTLMDCSVFDYNTNFMCPYHSIEGNDSKWCAKICATKAFCTIESVLADIQEMFNRAQRQERRSQPALHSPSTALPQIRNQTPTIQQNQPALPTPTPAPLAIEAGPSMNALDPRLNRSGQ